jgi:hypothetical protein
MRKTFAIAALLCLVFGLGAAKAGQRPIVVELFTSEGCSSCPPADALLAQLAERSDLLALSFHIDYWDRLGWKDPFSSAAATARQERYARLLGLATVYTPQIVVDGRFDAVGSKATAVAGAIAAAQRDPAGASMTLSLIDGAARIALGAAAETSPASVLLIGFDRRAVSSVARGENAGRTLAHADVVRGFERVGAYAGAPVTIEVRPPWPAERLAALAQAEDGRIIAAAILEAPAR